MLKSSNTSLIYFNDDGNEVQNNDHIENNKENNIINKNSGSVSPIKQKNSLITTHTNFIKLNCNQDDEN